jgi:uncharacterized protein YwgA
MSKALLASCLEVPSPPVDLKSFRYSFDTRLEAQKLVYLMRETGLPLRYNFGWYVHGPYSSSLADDLYSLSRQVEAGVRPTHSKVQERAFVRARTLLNSISRLEGTTKQRSYWLELMASIHFLMHYSYPRASSTKETLKEIRKLKGTKFSDADARTAIEVLKVEKLM